MKVGSIFCKCGLKMHITTIADTIECQTCKTIHDVTNFPEEATFVEEHKVDPYEEVRVLMAKIAELLPKENT